MNTVVLEVRPLHEALADAVSTMRARRSPVNARIAFDSPELLWKVLTVERWELLKALCGAGRITIREAAKRVGRGVKTVRADAMALGLAGIVDYGADRVRFPFDRVKVEFMLEAA